jgi:putative ABC transport system permease protein
VYLQAQPLALMPASVWDRLSQDPGVQQVIPLALGDAVGPYPVVGTSTAMLSGGRLFKVADGRSFSALDEAVIGAKVDHPLGQPMTMQHGAPQRGAAPGMPADTHHQSVMPVGRMAPTGGAWDHAVLVPIALLWSIHDHGDHGSDAPPAQRSTGPVPALLVQPRSVADAYRLRQQWRQGSTQAVFAAEVLADLLGTLGDVRRLLTTLALSTQALVLLSGLVTMALLLSTRRQAWAALRALGASTGFLFSLGWLLAMRVAGSAVLMALPLAAALLVPASDWLHQRTGLELVLRPAWADLSLPLALLAAMALAASALAWRASTRPVLDDLRS